MITSNNFLGQNTYTVFTLISKLAPLQKRARQKRADKSAQTKARNDISAQDKSAQDKSAQRYK